MSEEIIIKPIAHIECDFPEKFGVPRQSGLIDSLTAKIVFEPEYRDPNAFKGIEDYSHLWLIWQFSLSESGKSWSPTVRPPRLGGNKRMGVFATRSPFRPNPLGLSSVKLLSLENDAALGPVLTVSGADLVNGTPIYDIKPYLSFTDSHPEAVCGFADSTKEYSIEVSVSDKLLERVAPEKRDALIEILKSDPRPAYQNDPERIYGFTFSEYEIKFSVADDILRVTDIIISKKIDRQF